jgi:hypothetical protein
MKNNIQQLIPVGYINLEKKRITYCIKDYENHLQTIDFDFNSDFINAISSNGWTKRFSYNEINNLHITDNECNTYFNLIASLCLIRLIDNYLITVKYSSENPVFTVFSNLYQEIILTDYFTLKHINLIDESYIQEYKYIRDKLLELYYLINPIFIKIKLECGQIIES